MSDSDAIVLGQGEETTDQDIAATIYDVVGSGEEDVLPVPTPSTPQTTAAPKAAAAPSSVAEPTQDLSAIPFEETEADASQQQQQQQLQQQYAPQRGIPAAYTASLDSTDNRKLFVGGISWNTGDVAFRDFFMQFGEVEDSILMRDKFTQTSRGFGFVVFKDQGTAAYVLTQHLELDGRRLDAKWAVPRDQGEAKNRGAAGNMGGNMGGNFAYQGGANAAAYGGSQGNASQPSISRTTKIFVGGLPLELDVAGLKQYFGGFGEVSDAQIMMDHVTGRSRGFGFVTFCESDHLSSCAVES